MPELRSVLERADRAVAHVPLPADGLEGFFRRRDRRRRRQRITAGIVGAAVFLAVVWLVTGGPLVQSPTRTVPRGEDRAPQVPEPTAPPSAPGRRIALPPAEATPSGPARGELVMTYYGRPTNGVLQVLVYADGRVILRQEYGPIGADGIRTGFLERRLTPEGVMLLRSEVTSSELFDRDHNFDEGHNAPGGDLRYGLIWGEIRVDDGDGSVIVGWGPLGADPISEPATPAQARALKRLNDLFSDLVSMLPASAWQDPEARGYVPSRYAICYREAAGWYPDDVIEPSEVLNLLPTPATDLLRGKDRTYQPINGEGRLEVCSDVTTEEARSLAEILVEAGSERAWTGLTGAAEYAVSAPPPIDRAIIRFEPVLPHGQWSLFPG